jgi:hypothetical protein
LNKRLRVKRECHLLRAHDQGLGPPWDSKNIVDIVNQLIPLKCLTLIPLKCLTRIPGVARAAISSSFVGAAPPWRESWRERLRGSH